MRMRHTKLYAFLHISLYTSVLQIGDLKSIRVNGLTGWKHSPENETIALRSRYYNTFIYSPVPVDLEHHVGPAGEQARWGNTEIVLKMRSSSVAQLAQ